MKCNQILLKPVTRMVFQCTWRNCGHECDVREEIEEHVRIKHLGITCCTDDNEEDFYYTEVELDSPSSGVSSAGQSPMQSNINSVSTNLIRSNSPVFKQARKRGPKPKNKIQPHLIIESNNSNDSNILNSAVATWMHMDMARPAHEDPEYKSRISNNNKKTAALTIKRKRTISRQFASDQSDFELSQQQYLQNLSAEQKNKLKEQNNLHLQHNIQYLQELQRQHQQLNQLHKFINKLNENIQKVYKIIALF